MTYQTYHHNRNYGCRITEFVYEGYRSVALENEKLRVTVIADKSTDIYEFLYKPRDIDFMWRTWTGLRERAHFLPTNPRAAGNHMDYYEGGWQELLPNCGNLSLHQGAEIGQHGEVLLLPWRYHIVKDEVDEIEVRFEVRTVRTPFHLVKSLSLRRNESVLRIRERVTNESGQEVEPTSPVIREQTTEKTNPSTRISRAPSRFMWKAGTTHTKPTIARAPNSKIGVGVSRSVR